MSLKQSIVIKNEYTVKMADGKGTRGGTIGKYIVDYMAREEATEAISVKLPGMNLSDFSTRYMARTDATEELKLVDDGSIGLLKMKFKKIDKKNGRTFGSNNLSYSHDELYDVSDRIQQLYEDGHTVSKLVLSFSRDYMKDSGALVDDFVHTGVGGYKGNVDQLKLRSAVMSGMDRFVSVGNFVDPFWVGAAQMDTKQVHVHIVLVDQQFSSMRMMPDGGERGKINHREKEALRRGIHHGFHDVKALKSMHRQVDMARTNVVSFVKDYAYNQLNKNAGLQLLIASLPKDRKLWRYDTHNQKMAHSNSLAEKIVTDMFKEKPKESGFAKAELKVRKYATQKRKDDGLSLKERTVIYNKGIEDITRRSVNGLYGVLKSVPESKLVVQTPMLDVASMSDDELKKSLKMNTSEIVESDTDPVLYSMRVRGYNKRLQTHKNSAEVFHEYIDDFDDANATNTLAVDALMLRRFYEEELQYNMKLTDKYRKSFMYDSVTDRKFKQQMKSKYDDVSKSFDSVNSRIKLFSDVDDASVYEKLGVSEDIVLTDVRALDRKIEDVYGVKHGSYVFDYSTRQVVAEQLDQDVRVYAKDLRDYTFECFDKGVATSREWSAITMDHRDISDEDFFKQLDYYNTRIVAPFPPKTRGENIDRFVFDTVKSLDVHHLGLDFYGQVDKNISPKNAMNFISQYEWRMGFMDNADNYLTQTNQSLNMMAFVKADLVGMGQAVEIVQEANIVPVADISVVDDILERNRKTVRIDESIMDVAKAISAVLENERSIEEHTISESIQFIDENIND